MRCTDCGSVLSVEHVFERWYEDPRFYYTCATQGCEKQDADFGPAEYDGPSDAEQSGTREPFYPRQELIDGGRPVRR